MSLEGKLVEIFGLDDVLEPTLRMLEINPRMEPLYVNGLKGWACEYISDEIRYQVETFDGDYLEIPADNLRQYSPPAAADGGFDTVWPAEGFGDLEEFASTIARAVVDKSFCLVQMTNVRLQQSSIKTALMRDDWSRILPEFESGFLGTGSLGKTSWLATGTGDYKDDPLDQVDAMVTTFTTMLAAYQDWFGFAFGSRSAGLLRMPFEDENEASDLMRGAYGEQISGREIEGCMDFTKRRRIGLIVFLHGSGTITLTYNDGAIPPVEMATEQGKLLIFRHDLMSYSYKAKGTRNLALQAWIFREDEPHEINTLERAYQSSALEAWDKSKIPIAPTYGNADSTVDVMSMTCRLPGEVLSGEDYWALLYSGADAITKCHTYRWDNDFYYDATSRGDGKVYCQHFGMIDHTTIAAFDNSFFDIPDAEASQIDPAYRLSMEVGYETLARAGWTKQTLCNTPMACIMGTAATGWEGCYAAGNIWEGADCTAEGLFNVTTATVCAERTPYVLGIRGPAMYIDTACSSSLVSTSVAHAMLRPRMPGFGTKKCKAKFNEEAPSALVMGVMSFFDPGGIVGMCGAGMLTHHGRCFTFDASADGFCRSEGVDGMHLRINKKEELSRMAMLAGSASNQDGRSATLTAPNGPSQTAVAKQSMREAGITAFDIQTQELHGTGTPLGDPIEVGALRACMMRSEDGTTRLLPLIKGSSKAQLGHTEHNAGLTGLMKCCLMVMFSAAIPGQHIRLLNPNMDSSGYPVLFSSEGLDTGKDNDNCGVSSFGFSGCNARADVWGAAVAGPRKTLPIGLDLTLGRHEMFKVTNLPEAGRAGGDADTSDRPEVLGDVFVSGVISQRTTFSLHGTWSGWGKMEPMEKVPEMSFGEVIMYQSGFIMGETLSEEFRINVDNYTDNLIFPSCAHAGMDSIVLGPGQAPKGYNWKVEGQKDGATVGAIYVVSLLWYPATQQKKVTWELMEEDLELPFSLVSFAHSYSVKGSWTGWLWTEMQKVEDGNFEVAFRIGNRGLEEFHFARDSDDAQVIYPTTNAMANSMAMKGISGPDSDGRGKHWTVTGRTGDAVTLRLKIKDGQITLIIKRPDHNVQTWENLPVLALEFPQSA